MDKEYPEENPDIYTLSDDEGHEYILEVLDEADIGDAHYVAMIPVEDDAAADDSDLFVIMKQVADESGDEFFEEIEDEDEFNNVADFFSSRLDEVFDIED